MRLGVREPIARKPLFIVKAVTIGQRFHEHGIDQLLRDFFAEPLDPPMALPALLYTVHRIRTASIFLEEMFFSVTITDLP